jgi:hypothetical protein
MFMEREKHVSPQTRIEAEMAKVIELGNFELAHLFSEEGLLLAEAQQSGAIDRDSLIEVALHFQELRKTSNILDDVLKIKEVVMEGEKARKLVFRFFSAFDQLVVLALIIPPRKSYRKFTNTLVRLIQEVSA